MALFNVLFDIAAKTASFESSMTRIERRFDSVAGYAKKAAGVIGISFGVGMFKNGISGAIELGDEMGKLADKTGLTGAAASELSRVFQQNDLDNAALTTSLRKMQVELSKNNDVFDNLGMSVAALKSQDADQAFEDIAQRISEIEDPADRARVAVEIFGKSGADLLPLMMQGKAGIEALRKELGGLSNENITQLQAADDAIKKLEFLQQGFWNRAAVGVSSLAEAIGLIDRSPMDQLLADMDELVQRRDQAQSEVDSESSAGAFSKWWYGAEGERSLELAKQRLDDFNAQLRAKNAEYQRLSNASKSGNTDTDTDLNKNLNATAASLDYVTVSATKNREIALELVHAWADVNDTVLASGPEFQSRRDDFWLNQNESIHAWAESISVEAPEAIKKAAKDIEPWAEEMNRSMTSAFSDAFYNIGTGANTFADDIINAFKRILANAATSELFEILGNLGTSNSSSWWGSALSSLFSANAKGNAFGSGGLITAFANGGVVSGATPFAYAGGLGVMGEAGAEAVMPLSRDSSGKLGVASTGGGSTTTIAPTITIDARGATQDAIKLLPQVAQRASDDAVARILQMKRQGKI